ncbi:unnamed protein product [Choristocarpus tenellus]
MILTPSPHPHAMDVLLPAPTGNWTEVFSGCIDVTVAGAGTLDGVYTGSGTANGRPSYVSAIGSGQLSSSQALISCSGTDATNCEATQWTLGETSTDYVVYDEATRPEEITEVWLRLTGVSGEPAFVSITCGDGSGTPAPTSAPVVIETTGCETVSVEGTTSLDGIYSVEDPPIYKGYTQDLDGNWIINDNEIGAGITTTSGCDASDPNLVCSFNKWTISTSSGSQSYFTYNDAAHPVDISASALWYIMNGSIFLPYDAKVTLACEDINIDNGGGGGGGGSTVAIIVAVAVGASLLAILGLCVCKRRNKEKPSALTTPTAVSTGADGFSGALHAPHTPAAPTYEEVISNTHA